MASMKRDVSAAAMADAIGAIYDSAVDPDRWEDALRLVAGLIGGRTASIGISDALTRETITRVSWGVPEPFLSTYDEHVATMPFYTLYAAMAVEEAKAGSAMYDMDAFLDSRFYREWAQPQGLIDVAALCLMNDARRFGIFGINVGSDRGLVGPEDLAVVRALAPHLRRAATIGNLLDVGVLAAARLETALDLLAAGILLVDDDLGLLHANAAARAMLSGRFGLSTSGGRLAVHAPAAARALALAVAEAGTGDVGMERLGFHLPTVGPDGSAAILHVLPLRHGPRRQTIAPGAAAAVFLTTPARHPAAPTDAVAALYDLSRAESLVVDRIGAGRTPSEAAGELGVAPATIKTHLASVYRKTGTTRQSELVQLMESLATAVAAPS